MNLPSTAPLRTWRELLRDRAILSWALYDWANSAFATTVLAGFFPIFFKQYWSAGTNPQLSTQQLGNANSLASAALAFLSPVLGALADRASAKKRFLLAFTALGIVMTGALPLVAEGDWPVAVMLYVLASIGFAGTNTFYDALLVFVARKSELGRVSALGFSLGYLGGGVLFAINVLMTLKPEAFGLANATEAVRLSFVSVAIWWTVFTIPIFLFVKEPSRPAGPRALTLIREGFFQLRDTFGEIRKIKNIALFLAAYFFYIDGVNTVIKMAVDYGLALGFPATSLIVALLITQFVGFPAALGFNRIASRLGARTGLFLAIGVYVSACIYAYFMVSPAQFYVLAGVIGLVQGGIQALSRSIFGAMTPPERSGEFFGFYNMLGKFSAMMGPVLVGFVSVTTGSSRLSILSVILLFAIGGALLTQVKLPRSEGVHEI